VDFLLENEGKQQLYLNEINTMPGSLAFYLWEATGLPFDELVARLVHVALDRYRTRSGTLYSFEANLLQES
jgi:D-alanine-D-alanine ligase